jgi:hypothetical protein
LLQVSIREPRASRRWLPPTLRECTIATPPVRSAGPEN